jgi:hypothetical protein
MILPLGHDWFLPNLFHFIIPKSIDHSVMGPVILNTDISVGIAAVYGLGDRGIGVRFPPGEGDSFLLPSVQADSDARLALCLIGTGGVFLWGMKLTVHFQ